MNARLVVASALVALAVTGPAAAQNTSNGKRLLTPGVGSNTTPVALVDDATLLDPGGVSLSVSAMRWQGSGVSEINAPIVSGTVGLTRRVQLSSSVPYIIGSGARKGAIGRLGTVFLSGKIGLLNSADLGVKLALSPTVAVLGDDSLASMASGSSRAQLGLPLSFEVERGPASVYTSVGYYSTGSWFAGIGGGLRATPKVYVSLGFSRAWTKASTTDPTLVAADRSEVSVGVSRALAAPVSLYVSISQTVATLQENGAGTTLTAGVSLFRRGH